MNDSKTGGGNFVIALVRLVRPLDWSKSSFVFAGLLFAHAWTDVHKVQQALLAAAAFSIVASSVYIFNDLLDRERDAHHPKKRHRPLASGAIAPGVAIAVAAMLFAGGLAVGYSVSTTTVIFLGVYATLNVAYSVRLKHVVLLDVFIIASGFVLRILVGTVGLDIRPSPWILLCGLTLALFLGFSKRRAELLAAGDEPGKHRKVLDAYTPRDLEQMIAICGTCAIITYCLYTIDPKTQQTHGTAWLMATVPFVIYSILRYIHRLHTGSGGRPAVDIVRDPHQIVSVLGWIAVTLWLLT